MKTELNSNEVARAAANLDKKASNSSCFSLVLEAIKNGGQLTDQDLIVLYNKYLPALPAAKKTAWDWVRAAKGVKDVRYFLNNVFVDKENIVSADGHRIHVAKNTENLKPGHYDVAGQHLGDDGDSKVGKYPDYMSIFVDERDAKWEKAKASKLEIKSGDEYNPKQHYVKIGLAWVDKGYLDAVLNKTDKFEYFQKDAPLGAITIKPVEKSELLNTELKAILMPIRC